MVSIRISVNDLTSVLDLFDRVSRAALRPRQFWPVVIEEYQNMQTDWFDSQGRGSWAPLSPGYAAWKSIYAPGQPLLVLDGALRDETDFETRESDRELEIDISAPFYWFYHQYGTVKMPARPPFLTEQDLQDKLSRVLIDEYMRYLRGL